MTLLALDEGEQAQISFTDLRLQSRRRIRPLAPAPLTHQEIQQETTFDADLVAQLAILRSHAQKLTRNREQALDLVQDTCERALRFRHLFREGTSMRAWVLTIMRHHFLDQAKRSRDAMVRSRSVPMEELSELVHSDARAEQIRFVKEALGLARDGLSEEQGSVFWPILTGATLEACAALHGVPKGTVSTRLHRARSFMRRACVARPIAQQCRG